VCGLLLLIRVPIRDRQGPRNDQRVFHSVRFGAARIDEAPGAGVEPKPRREKL